MVEYSIQHSGEATFVLEHKQSKGKPYTLKAASEKEAREWVQALQQVGPMKPPEKGKVFGAALDKLELSANGIPIFMEQIISFLSKGIMLY